MTNADRGAAYLDAHYPGWEHKIDLQELNLDDCSRCIIGQINGGRSGLFSKIWMKNQCSPRFMWDLGFVSRVDEPDWHNLILARRAQRELPSAEETFNVARRIMNNWAVFMDRVKQLAGIR